MYNLFFDGSSNTHGIGFGYIIKSKDSKLIEEKTFKVEHRDLTSNTAEYSALISGLLALVKLNIKEVKVFGDSQLVINQVNGDFKVKSAHLKMYYLFVQELIPLFDKIEFIWIPRKENSEADRISR